jgi:hypothetical protein
MRAKLKQAIARGKAILLLFQAGQLKFQLLAGSFFLLLISSVFEGFSFGLLVPFLKQASGQGVYEGWRNIPIMGSLLSRIQFESFTTRLDWLLAVIVIAVLIRQSASYASRVLFYTAAHMFEARLRIRGYQKLLR